MRIDSNEKKKWKHEFLDVWKQEAKHEMLELKEKERKVHDATLFDQILNKVSLHSNLCFSTQMKEREL